MTNFLPEESFILPEEILTEENYKILPICSELNTIRTLVQQKFGYKSTDYGKFWLPVVATARGNIYAEVITQLENGKYHQPFHMRDRLKQPLYRLGFQLLDALDAGPSVYLLQFDMDSRNDENKALLDVILFDRLIPFPSAPAIASVGIQEPDLFECHLLCTTNQPIYDVVIKNIAAVIFD